MTCVLSISRFEDTDSHHLTALPRHIHKREADLSHRQRDAVRDQHVPRELRVSIPDCGLTGTVPERSQEGMAANDREMRIRALRAQGLSQGAIARELEISRRTVGRIERRLAHAAHVPFSVTAPAASPDERGADPPFEFTQDLPAQEARGQAETPASLSRATGPSAERCRIEADPPGEAGMEETGAAAEQPPMEDLPSSAHQLYNMAVRISQVEMEQLYRAAERIRQAEVAHHQAWQDVQKARAEHWRMQRGVTQSIGELLQAAARVLQALPGEYQEGDTGRTIRRDRRVTPAEP